MTKQSDENQTEMMMRMMLEGMRNNQRSGPGFLTGVLTTVLTLAVGVGGTVAYFKLNEDEAPISLAAAVPAAPVATTSASAGGPASTVPQLATVPQAASTPTLGGSGNARIAQSENGTIYAFEPTSGLAFQFVVGGGAPVQITRNEIPADVRDRLLAPGAPTPSSVVDPNALASQAAAAQAALAAQVTTDRRRPPINQLLQADPKAVVQIVTGLQRAQGIIQPTADAEAAEPMVYAFFDPRCPHCHVAYQGLDGQLAIKWLPVSVFGPDGEENHAFIMGETQISEQVIDGQTLSSATFVGEDSERTTRLGEYMSVPHNSFNVPSDVEITEGQEFVLGENAELFRLLSRGAEELRAVPSFFIVGGDGRAVWLQGYESQTPNLMREIIAGNAS